MVKYFSDGNKMTSKLKPMMELHFTPTNGPMDEAIEALMDAAGGIVQRAIVREMILSALKAGQENRGRADLKLMNASLKEMRFTTKIFSAYRDKRKVTIFGSARTARASPAYRMALDLGRQLAAAGYMVITGGGPGIMQAANEGAGPEHSFGVNIRLPFEQKPNPVLENNPRSIFYKYFFNRKVAFVKEAHAVALFPGGFGTLDEAMETLTLVQTGKRDPLPLVLVEPPGEGYWAGWHDFIDSRLFAPGRIDTDDLSLFEIVASVEDAVARIDRFYRRYHSLRYVNGRCVLRLTAPLSSEQTRGLEAEFDDLLVVGGRIQASTALPEEADQPEIAHLPRLLVDFDRHRFGRLRQLIDRINGLA
jgi:hypothetical protein